MGHLDLRISGDEKPKDGRDAPPKDGASVQPSATSPNTDDPAETTVEKAPDVLKSDNAGQKIVR